MSEKSSCGTWTSVRSVEEGPKETRVGSKHKLSKSWEASRQVKKKVSFTHAQHLVAELLTVLVLSYFIMHVLGVMSEHTGGPDPRDKQGQGLNSARSSGRGVGCKPPLGL